MESTLRLFKALPISNKAEAKDDPSVLQKTLPYGFIFDPGVIANYPDTGHIIDLVNAAYGRNSQELNQSFHKSWAKVRDASHEELVLEQLLHYFTTYGFEALGIYDKDTVYIPNEELQAPELEEGIRLVVIRGYTKEELKQKLLQLLGLGVALSEQTVADVLDVASFVGLEETDIDKVRNKEVKVALYDYFGIVPGDPSEFLRYVVYRASNQTLLIKNKTLTSQLQGRDNLDVARYFDIYEREFGLARLAQIFYRYKPIFLAFRTNTKLKKSVNRIRRLAVANHKPMPRDFLNDITAEIGRGNKLEFRDFIEALEQASVFRKIRLAYALKFRTTDADSILYRVRNGKSYAKEFSFSDDNKLRAQAALDNVMHYLTEDIAKSVKGKKIFIPAGVKYGLPATEKQFTGNLPSGTYVEIDEHMVAGIHWENQGGHRVDLDLSIQNAAGKIGWDASYRNDQRNVLFSGDITDAPKPDGASELFYFGQEARGVWLMFLNYYNFDANVPVPFKLLVAKEQPKRADTHYTVDPNNIVALSNTSIEVRQKQIGLIIADENSCRFYFAETALGTGRSLRSAAYTEQARKFLLNQYTDPIVLNDILVAAGAEMVNDPAEADVDLSPEAVDKTTILGLLQGGELAYGR